ncbi:hypothetical protein SynRS9909_01769 [Synechococcus sp. RS9909]|uniref:hypothetical protein n=1 Tax=unclassified Synechococcus TaxID=2626047 RepID=UPI000068F632|nr:MULTISPECIES: hypothetical protein [unclassified Synechococcus]EAQ69979.1 hypothetical protein RS9917_11096 [Synechococcus sp. RS9917]QNI79752.1 hypothetical protein SynRS9909_01769 [Synechococcus sp. RS9909]
MSAARRYRLTDAAMQPHPYLDVDYPSLQEALDAARHWSRNRALDSYQACIGVEVSTERGDWRTLTLPTEIQQLELISKG